MTTGGCAGLTGAGAWEAVGEFGKSLQEGPGILHQYLHWRWCSAMGGWGPSIHYQRLGRLGVIASHGEDAPHPHRAAGLCQNPVLYLA